MDLAGVKLPGGGIGKLLRLAAAGALAEEVEQSTDGDPFLPACCVAGEEYLVECRGCAAYC